MVSQMDEVKNERILCPACKTENRKDPKFCVECGKNLRETIAYFENKPSHDIEVTADRLIIYKRSVFGKRTGETEVYKLEKMENIEIGRILKQLRFDYNGKRKIYNFKKEYLDKIEEIFLPADKGEPKETTETKKKRPKIIEKDLAVTPRVGPAPLTIESACIIKNTGDIQGEYTAKFKVNRKIVKEQTVTVKAGETKKIRFTRKLEAGTYNVTINNLKPVEVRSLAPAKMSVKKFDLNIEKILEDWDVSDAIREVIANALDEQLLTKTKDIEIFKDRNGIWHIRDYGRGLKYEHLTQKENDEKLKNPHVIGKFGIGLKDALATFDRKGVRVFIKSRFGDITLAKSKKHGFEDIVTIHANISPPSDPNFIGTEFMLENVSDEDIAKAKDLFLRFSGENVIEKTEYGDVLKKRGETARIYINGVKVAEEENFLFSYNITSLTKKIRQALNRERSNVGRSAYSDRVMSILLSCNSKEVAEYLINDLKNFSTGEMHDELKWVGVQEHAVKILNAAEKVVFLTSEELISSTHMVDEAKSSGYKIVTVPNNLKERISGMKDITGNTIRDLGQFYKEYEESFEFKFTPPDKLSISEKEVFDKTDKIFSLIGGRPRMIKEIKISETMRKELGSFIEAEGLWDKTRGRIIIKRDQLASMERYAGTLLHETAHAISDTQDVSKDFEIELTKIIGSIISKVLEGNL